MANHSKEVLDQLIEDRVTEYETRTRPLTPEEIASGTTRDIAPSPEWLRNFAREIVYGACEAQREEAKNNDTAAIGVNTALVEFLDEEYHKMQTAQVRQFIDQLRAFISRSSA